MKAKISDLKFDDKNFNKGTKIGGILLDKSFEKFGAGRSILIDKNNKIIAGNKSAEHFAEIGDEVQIVETDGKKLIAVKRMDIDLDTPEGREFALADNATANANIKFDFDLLESELEDVVLAGWGMERSETSKLSSGEYQSIYYEPENKPNVKLLDCIDFTMFNAKIKAIEESDLPEEKKTVLKWFAQRFLKIDFENVANYYFFNADEKEQEIMRRLRLVLCDNGVNGFIEDQLLLINDIILGDDEESEDD